MLYDTPLPDALLTSNDLLETDSIADELLLLEQQLGSDSGEEGGERGGAGGSGKEEGEGVWAWSEPASTRGVSIWGL